jgi:glycosyltransferase involved in cell wall biosynthesis
MDITVGVHAMTRTVRTERNAFKVARGFARRGHRLDLVAARDGKFVPEHSTSCRSVSHRPVFDFVQASAPRDLSGMTPAVVTAANKRPKVLYRPRLSDIVWGAAAGRLTRAPLVCHRHDCRHTRPGSFPNTHVRRLIAVSHFSRRQWVSLGIETDKIDVVDNGPSGDDYPIGGLEERARARARLGLDEEAFVAMYYGRLDPEEVLDVLMDAWRRLGVGGTEGTLLVVVSPSAHLPDGARYAANLQPSAPRGVVWLQPQTDVVVLLHAADVVAAQPLWAEPLGRVIVETLATGRPAVVSRTGGTPELLDGPFERFLVGPGDAGMLASALASLVDWRDREPALAAALCRDHVRDRFSLDHLVEGVERSLSAAAGRILGRRHG